MEAVWLMIVRKWKFCTGNSTFFVWTPPVHNRFNTVVVRYGFHNDSPLKGYIPVCLVLSYCSTLSSKLDKHYGSTPQKSSSSRRKGTSYLGPLFSGHAWARLYKYRKKIPSQKEFLCFFAFQRKKGDTASLDQAYYIIRICVGRGDCVWDFCTANI